MRRGLCMYLANCPSTKKTNSLILPAPTDLKAKN